MGFTIDREQLRRSGNECLVDLRKETEKNQFPEGVISLPCTGQEGDIPAFIRDFAKNSALLQGKSVNDLYEKDLADYKASQDFASNDETESKIGLLRELYKKARLANMDFTSQLPWVESRKEDMADLDSIQDEDKLNHLYSLLVLDRILCAQELNDTQYAETLAKILNHYSQLLKSQISKMYTSYLGAQDFGFYQYAVDPDRVTADVRLSPKDPVTVECKLERDVPVQPGGGMDDLDDTRALAPLSAKFELTSDYASLVEIKTEDPIHWVVVMGYDPKNFDSTNGFSNYLKGGPAEPLRKSINLAHYEHAKRKINWILDEKADSTDPLLELKTALKPEARKIADEIDRLVFKNDDPIDNNREIEAMTAHLTSLSLCFEARDAKEMIGGYDKLLESSNTLKALPVSPDPEKGFTVSHRFAEVLKHTLFFSGVLLFVIGVALALTGVGIPVGLALLGVGVVLAGPIALNLKLPLDNEMPRMDQKVFGIFRDRLEGVRERADTQAVGGDGEMLPKSDEEALGLRKSQ
jgi:hypothetical protein